METETTVKTAGPHKHAEELGCRDVNNRFMVNCSDCGTYAHAYTKEDAWKQLAGTACAPECENCQTLRRSHTGAPAVPVGGTRNDITHTCPNDGNKWWQSNDALHLWQQVTDEEEWASVSKPRSASQSQDDF